MARANPLYQGPDSVFDNPLYENMMDSDGDASGGGGMTTDALHASMTDLTDMGMAQEEANQ